MPRRRRTFEVSPAEYNAMKKPRPQLLTSNSKFVVLRDRRINQPFAINLAAKGKPVFIPPGGQRLKQPFKGKNPRRRPISSTTNIDGKKLPLYKERRGEPYSYVEEPSPKKPQGKK